MAVIDHVVPDNPTNNFATLNPLDTAGSTSTPLNLTEGNLRTTHTQTGQHQGTRGTISVSSGMWYFEVAIVQRPNGTTENYSMGFYKNNVYNGLYYALEGNLSFGSYGNNAEIFVNTTRTSYGSIGGNGSIYMFCLDVDNEKFWVGLDGNWFASGNPSTGANPSASGFGKANWSTYQSHYTYSNGNWGSFHHNYGQDSSFGGLKSGSANATDENGLGEFYYSPPTGALALCTQNIPTPSVDSAAGNGPEDYFKPVVISGTNADNNDVDVGFRPDLCWLKKRNGASGHMLVDSVSGAGYALQSDSSGQQGVYNTNSDFREFTSTGFKLGAVSSYGSSNPSGTNNIISWNWKAGGAPTADNDNTSGAMDANSVSLDGVLQSSYTPSGSPTIYPKRMSIGTKQGMSIISYTGNSLSSSTIPHGLTKAPEIIIVKNLSSADQWVVYHKGVASDAETDYLILNSPAAAADLSSIWNDTAPTNEVFSIGNGGSISEPSENFIAYCWHSVPGYSAFESYTGNGSTDGPFVYTGFRPAWVIVKWISGGGLTTGSWRIMDTARNPYNPATLDLMANEAVTETTYGSDDLDILSNGFKWRSTGSFHNTNNANYIYMAFAEQPINYANAR